jgi:hypothetical protein
MIDIPAAQSGLAVPGYPALDGVTAAMDGQVSLPPDTIDAQPARVSFENSKGGFGAIRTAATS